MVGKGKTERIGDKLAFLGNEDGHHGNCSQESHDAEERVRERAREERGCGASRQQGRRGDEMK